MKKKKVQVAFSKNSSTPITSRWWNRDWILGILLVVETVLFYLPSVNGKPIWDDDQYMTPAALQSLSGLARIWTQPGTTAQYYPITYSMFWIQQRLWGAATPGYHIISILLHAASALVLFRILRRLEVPGAPLAAGLFALHPVQVESVAWISELKNTFSGLLCLGALFTFLQFRFGESRRRIAYGVSLILFVMALLTKTVVATLPAALLVILWWKRGKVSWKQDVLPLMPFLVLGSGLGLISAWMERTLVGASGVDYQFTVVERCLIAGRAVWFYLGKLAWPQPLVFIYPRWQINQGVWWQYLFPLSALGLLAILWWRRKRKPGMLAALLLFVGTLLPALGFLNVFPFRYSFVADHFQYLACIAPLSLAAAGISAVAGRYGISRLSVLRPVFGILLVSFLGVLTWQQSGTYSDVETLWQTTIDRNPECWMANANLGLILLQKGQADTAIYYLDAAVRIKPDYADAHNSLALALLQMGKPEAAIPQFEEAIEINPDYAVAYDNLGTVLQEKGQLDAAVSEYKKALAIKPDYIEAHFNLGIALIEENQIDPAIAELEYVVTRQPDDAEGHQELGLALLKKGEEPDAIAEFRKALALKPDNVETINDLAWVEVSASQPSLRDPENAIALEKHVLQLTGDTDPTALQTLSIAYAETGDFEDALKTSTEALQLAVTKANPALAAVLQKEIAGFRAHQLPVLR